MIYWLFGYLAASYIAMTVGVIMCCILSDKVLPKTSTGFERVGMALIIGIVWPLIFPCLLIKDALESYKKK